MRTVMTRQQNRRSVMAKVSHSKASHSPLLVAVPCWRSSDRHCSY